MIQKRLQKILALIFLFIPAQVFSYTFNTAIKNIKEHDKIISLKHASEALLEEGKTLSSWGDPMLKLSFKNFPVDSLKDNETPMTGVEIGLSQKISLTNKYGNIKNAYSYLSKAKEFESINKTNYLIKTFWEILIEDKKLSDEIHIINENINWIKNILKVSKRLYANGKISQQALLEIEIRKSELQALLSNTKYDKKGQQDRLSYILGLENKDLKRSTIPWKILKKMGKAPLDTKEEGLKTKLQAKGKMLNVSKLNFVPDLTISAGYTKRSNIDNKGDFVSLTVSLALPTSGKKYSKHAQTVLEKNTAHKELKNYQIYKKSESNRFGHKIQKLKNEISILSNKTIKFAENSRKITSKSYGLGNSTYIELLKSEFKLQSLLTKKVGLEALLLKTRVRYKYLVGEKLYE